MANEKYEIKLFFSDFGECYFDLFYSDFHKHHISRTIQLRIAICFTLIILFSENHCFSEKKT